MKKLQSILSTLGAIGIALNFTMVYGQGWGEVSAGSAWPEIQQGFNGVPQFPQPVMPVPQRQAIPAPPQYAVPFNPAPNYAADRSLDELAREIENLKSELAKKSDKPDPKKGFTAPKINGRVFMDSVNIIHQDDDGLAAIGQGKNLLGFREARLAATGTAYDFLDYKLELGFEGTAQANFKDVFLGINDVPVLGYIRIGNQYVENAGSEICNGTTNYTFMELPAPAGGQFTARRLGMTSRHLFARNRVRLFFGAFGAQDVSSTHISTADHQGIILNTRLTHALMFQKEGKCMFLYGGYYSYTEPQSVTVNNRPGGWNLGMPPLISYPSENGHKMGLETVYQNGPLCLQADVFVRYFSEVNPDEDAMMYGGFVMGRYLLTKGDYRKYSLENACWGSLVVNRPFLLFQRGASNFMQGPGTWEIAAYYGYLNAEDFKNAGGVYGSDHEIGAALNWYWNPQLKWALNYVHQMAEVTSGTHGYKPSMDIVAMSCRFHW